MNKNDDYRYKLEKARKELEEMVNFAYVDQAIQWQILKNDIEIEEIKIKQYYYKEIIEDQNRELTDLIDELNQQDKEIKIQRIITLLIAGVAFFSFTMYPKFTKTFCHLKKHKELIVNCKEFSQNYLIPLSSFENDKNYFYCQDKNKSIFIDFSGQSGNLEIIRECAKKDGFENQYYFDNEWELYAAAKMFSVNEAVGLYYIYNTLGEVYINNTINGFNTVYQTNYQNLGDFFNENNFNSIEEWQEYVIYNVDSKKNYVLERKNKNSGIINL